MDVEITGAEFEGKAEGLTFGTLNLADKQTVTTQQIINQIPEKAKTGYTLKSISDLSDLSIAETLKGGSGWFIRIKKKGRFTAKLVLEKLGHFDVEIAGATFEGKAPRLTFGTFRLANVDEITAQQIVRQIPEKAKIGYTLKRISDIKDLSGAGIATLTGAPPTSLHIKKNGRFSATLVLEKSGHFEVEITGAVFEVLKSIFVFHKATQTITGIKADQQAYVNTLTTISFPDEIDGVTVKKIKGSLTGVKENIQHSVYYVINAKNVFGTNRNQNIQTIHLPRNLETIGAYAFHYCDELTGIKIPDSVTTIERHAFNNCIHLRDATLSRNLETIGDYAFSNCKSLYRSRTLSLPNTLKTIGQNAFRWCGFKRLEIPDSVKIIEYGTFSNCGSLELCKAP